MRYRASKASIKFDGVTIARCVGESPPLANESNATEIARMLNEHHRIGELEGAFKALFAAYDEPDHDSELWERRLSEALDAARLVLYPNP